MKEKALEIIKQGPTIPSQIAKNLGTNILITNAILSTLISEKKIACTHKKIGNSPLYYAPEQKKQALEIIEQRLEPREKQLLQKIRQRPITENELTPQERYFLKQLKDFVEPIKKNNTTYWKLWNQKTTIPLPQQPTQKPRPTKQTNFEKKIEQILQQKNAEIIEKEIIRQNTEINYVIKIPTTLIKQQYFVKAKNKKTINEKELIQTWYESQKTKLPTILLTTGKLTKKAQKTLEKELKNVMNVVRI